MNIIQIGLACVAGLFLLCGSSAFVLLGVARLLEAKARWVEVNAQHNS